MKPNKFNSCNIQPTFAELKQFLLSHNISPKVTITLDKLDRLLESAGHTFGEYVFAWLMDSFMPEGDAVEPGYEDSCSHYYFTDQSWDEFEASWNGRNA